MIDVELMNEIREAAAQGKTSLHEEVCGTCGGNEIIVVPTPIGQGYSFQLCRTCGGDGWMKEGGKPFNNCPTCNDTGKENAK